MSSMLRAAATVLPRHRPSTLPATTLTVAARVDREHLAAYDRVCGFPLSDTLPPTYPHVLAFPAAMRLMTAPAFPFPVVGLVHVAQRITVHRPLTGEELDLAVRAENLRPHQRGQQFDVVASTSSWTGVSTYLRVSGRGSSSSNKVELESTASWPIPLRVGTDYAAVSGDHNPIHTSRLGARMFGFKRPIAHGMWTMARCLAALGARLPAAYTVDVAFKKPLFLPARVSFSVSEADGRWEFRAGPHLAGTVTPF
ncbi:MaoC family dehydratase [Actinoplanes sp. NPDC049265]|uniref:MaoC family dehydratase n=1 Tax=Actinoplanes sp. NPDC049265 TaxID=3363902 RepID=UPI003713D9EF